MSNTLVMTIKEYENSKANTEGLSYPAITKRIRKVQKLPNVASVACFGRFYLLNVTAPKK